MAVRDLLWACPLCRSAGAIRPARRVEQCTGCGATFRRDRGANIAVSSSSGTRVRPAREWLESLGPLVSPRPDEDGRILGPERVTIRIAGSQRPVWYGRELLGWIEVYGRPERGKLTLRTDGLHFDDRTGSSRFWSPADFLGLQPASSALQITRPGEMTSVRFLNGSVRLWTRALSDVIRQYHRREGRDVLELQPRLRTCLFQESGS